MRCTPVKKRNREKPSNRRAIVLRFRANAAQVIYFSLGSLFNP